MKSPTLSIWISGAVLFFVGTVCIALTLYPPAFQTILEQNFRDQFLRTATSSAPDPRIAVIDLDESSLQRIGPWPWKRAQIADLAEKLLIDEGAASVALDIIFPLPRDQEGDARLAAIGQIAPLTFAYVLDYIERTPPLHVGQLPVPAGNFITGPIQETPKATGHMANHAGLANVRCAGNIGYIPDTDGVVRTVPLLSEYKHKNYWSLSQALLICAGLQPTPEVTDQMLWRLPFRQAISSLLVISAADLLQGNIPNDLLQGRHVLVGSSSLALGDHVSTPLSPLAAGVFVHAAALAALLDYHAGEIHPSRMLSWIPLAWILLTFFLFWISLRHLSPLINMAVVSLSGISWIIFSYTNITIFNISHSIVVPLWGYTLITILVFPLEWWISRKKEHALLKVFGSYVGKPVLTELIRLDLKGSLKPSLREVTVLIVDMQGYTQRIRNMSLEQAAEFTRSVLESLTQPILENKGTLDKYMGDGLVAFWGAPLPSENHADMAVSCALLMQKNIKNLSNRYPNLAPPLKIRIGIESGTALVGDLGTSFRSSYTAVGDCLNLASRLESLAKRLDEPLLIGEKANHMLRKYQTVSLGKHPIRDTDGEIEVFTLH